MPPPEMYNGDFSNWVTSLNGQTTQVPIFDPTTQVRNADGSVTRTPFPGNRIPASAFDPIAKNALAAYTAGGQMKLNNGALPGTVGYQEQFLRFKWFADFAEYEDQREGRSLFNEKHRISGYYGYNRSSVVPGANGPSTLPGNYSNYNDTQRDSDVVRMSWDWTLSPTKLNHFYAGGNNWRENHDPVQATIKSGINWKDKVCLGNVPDCSQNLLNLDFGDITGWGGRANNGSENTIYSFAELRKRGVRHDLAAKTAGSGHGPWRLADSPGLYIALPNAYFDSLGIPGLKVRS